MYFFSEIVHFNLENPEGIINEINLSKNKIVFKICVAFLNLPRKDVCCWDYGNF